MRENQFILGKERKKDCVFSLLLFPFLVIFNLPVQLDVLISFCTVHPLVWQRRRTNAHRARVEDDIVGCPWMLVYWSSTRWMKVRWDSSSWPSLSQRNPSGLWVEQIHLTSFHDAYQSKQEETGTFWLFDVKHGSFISSSCFILTEQKDSFCCDGKYVIDKAWFLRAYLTVQKKECRRRHRAILVQTMSIWK